MHRSQLPMRFVRYCHEFTMAHSPWEPFRAYLIGILCKETAQQVISRGCARLWSWQWSICVAERMNLKYQRARAFGRRSRTEGNDASTGMNQKMRIPSLEGSVAGHRQRAYGTKSERRIPVLAFRQSVLDALPSLGVWSRLIIINRPRFVSI